MLPRFTHVTLQQLRRVFDLGRATSDDPNRVEANCAEQLGVYGLVRHWLETNVQDREDLRLQWRSFDSCCRLLDLILQVKRRPVVVSDGVRELAIAASQFLECSKAAYETEHAPPKHH